MPAAQSAMLSSEEVTRLKKVFYQKQPVIESRDYRTTVKPRIDAIAQMNGVIVETYGQATYPTENPLTGEIDTVTHDLSRIIVGDLDPNKKTFIVIGGTHGYEKGGPLAALKFAEEDALKYAEKDDCNIIIYPCLNPGPYEKELRHTIGRIDANRDAKLLEAESEAMQAFVQSINALHKTMFKGDLSRKFTAACDLHETPKKDLELAKEDTKFGGSMPDLTDFPYGFSLILNQRHMPLGEYVMAVVANENHPIVEGDEMYGMTNYGGILHAEDSKAQGTVRQFMEHYTEHGSMTTELCDINLDDSVPDDERLQTQLLTIRAMISFNYS